MRTRQESQRLNAGDVRLLWQRLAGAVRIDYLREIVPLWRRVDLTLNVFTTLRTSGLALASVRDHDHHTCGLGARPLALSITL